MKKVIGYARVSTTEQDAGLQDQVVKLTAVCDEVVKEKASAVGKREVFETLLSATLRREDELVVTTLSRLARSTADLLAIVDTLEKKGVTLRILDLNLDTGTAQGRMMLTMIGALAQFERELMLERQKIGIAKAKEEGKYKGRKPSAMSQKERVIELVGNGMSKQEVANALKIGVASVYRILKEAK